MKEIIGIIIAFIALIVALVLVNNWNGYIIAGLILVSAVTILLLFDLIKKEIKKDEVLPDTRYTYKRKE